MYSGGSGLSIDIHFVDIELSYDVLSPLPIVLSKHFNHPHPSLHDRVVKKGVSFLRGNVSIITSSDLSDMHVISMNVILPPRRREG